MTPDALAALHGAAFRTERPWSASEFRDLLSSPLVTLFAVPAGFALTRTVAGESELLTLAVHPDQQGKGIGRTLLRRWLADMQQTAEAAFLEVAADNTAAISLYTSEGFSEIARRPAYYARKNAAAADAVVLRRSVTLGQGAKSAPLPSESG